MLLNYHVISTTKFLAFIYLFFTAIVVEGIVPKANYRTPKNIIFSTQGGGSSHHMWVLELLEEMHNRGHSVSLYTKGDQIQFAKDYPMVKTREVGGPNDIAAHPLIAKYISIHPTIMDIALASTEASLQNYTKEFADFTSQYKAENISLVICDSYAVSCLDSAIASNIPVVMTSTYAISNDISAPYINNKLYTLFNPSTKEESLWTRIKRDYFELPLRTWLLSRRLKESKAIQLRHGLRPSIDSTSPGYNLIPKIVNNVFGIEAARKHSPLVHMAGPIMRKSYPDLDVSTKDFLDSHRRVVYIAFGQHSFASDKDVQIILHSLLRLKEEKHIDGIIWARIKKAQLPTTIQTPERTYLYKDLANSPDIYLMDWVPQFATLQHPSTLFFISHGGAGSLHEAMFSGVRLLVFPFVGDQPLNARNVQHSGLGRYFDTLNMKYNTDSYEALYKAMLEVAVDYDNIIQEAVNHYSAFMQISASNAVSRGADLLEESLFASNAKGQLYYRKDVGYEINWLKRNNIDVYFTLSVLGALVIKLVSNTFRFFLSSSKKSKNQLQKKKQ